MTRRRFIFSPMVVSGSALLLPMLVAVQSRGDLMQLRTEHFDTNTDLNNAWEIHNSRFGNEPARSVNQNFGFKPNSQNAGGTPPSGEIGGLINPAGETAYYAKSISNFTLNDTLSASGKLKLTGEGNTLLGFINTNTVNEWRTANSLVLRLYGRTSYFFAYPEYATDQWRAGATGFVEPVGGAEVLFPVNQVLDWTLNYNPAGNGTITATIGNGTFGTKSATKVLDAGHKADGAIFNHFGLLAVNKSHDTAGNLWVDNISINGAAAETFATDPSWDSLRNTPANGGSYITDNVRFRFNFGYSNTNNADGASPGEAGGDFFRGDDRDANHMAYYGDQLDQTLTLDQPLHAHGKVSFHRGVTDSTVQFGFFHSTDSVRVYVPEPGEGQWARPENFVGVSIEGPSAEGFFFYPIYNTDEDGQGGSASGPPYIYPNGASHDWTLDYDPNGAGGNGRIRITLDGQESFLNLEDGHKEIGANFNRFGFITTHTDGNGQTVFVDDVTYTVGYTLDPQWSLDGSGSWQTSGNWVGSIPNAVGATATFASAITANRLVYANSPVTVGTIIFDDNNTYMLGGLGSLTLQVLSGLAQINVLEGTHRINLPLTIASNTQLNVPTGTGLVISDPVTIAANKMLTKIGSGTVTYQSTVTLLGGAGLSMEGSSEMQSLAVGSDSTVNLTSGGDTVLKVESLAMNNNAKLDLHDNQLIVEGGDFDAIQNLVIEGFNGGDWLGDGITSTSAANDTSFVTALGIVDNAETGYGSFGGNADLDGDEVLVKYTWYGDADLSGAVNLDDFTQFLAGFNEGAGGPFASWFNGDFDYNGSVNLDDFNQFLHGLANQSASVVSTELFGALVEFVKEEGVDVDLSTVPEPSAIGVVGLAVSCLMQRRRR